MWWRTSVGAALVTFWKRLVDLEDLKGRSSRRFEKMGLNLAIKSGCRLADEGNAPFYALHVLGERILAGRDGNWHKTHVAKSTGLRTSTEIEAAFIASVFSY